MLVLDNFAIASDEIFSEEKLQQAEQDFSKFSNNENNDGEEAREKFEAMLNQPIPVIRRVPVKNTQADLNQLQVSLTFAQLFAKAYWDGKEDFGPLDLLSLMFESDKTLNIEDVQDCYATLTHLISKRLFMQ